jgi:3-oxoacyl-[acyl-carrier-protein] synthase I
MQPVAILKSGMVTSVGFNAPSSCAAIRVGITGFVETRFMYDGEWLIGSPVPFEEGWRGREKLLQMVVPAIAECIEGFEPEACRHISLLLCVSEEARPGRFAGIDQSFFEEVQRRLGRSFSPQSYLIARGRMGAVQAVDYARRLIGGGQPYCLVAGVDTYLVAATLDACREQRRLLTADNSDGFIPGEAAAAVLLGRATGAPGELACIGIGYGSEPAPVGSGAPSRADGMVAAFNAAFAEAGITMGQTDYRITDLSGEQYGFKEAALALLRTLRERKEEYDIWHPADCIGEVGAASVPAVLAVAAFAAHKGYAPGSRVLCHFAADGPERAALVLGPVEAMAARSA